MSDAETSNQRYWMKYAYRAYDHPVVRQFAEQRVEILRPWLQGYPIASVLDVGCGNGFSSFYMRSLATRMYGVDLSSVMLQRHPLPGRLALADALALPFPAGSFDLVFGWEVLHHIPDPSQALAEMGRVSRHLVLIAEPNRNNPAQCLFGLVDREHRLSLRYTCRFMEQNARRGGLKVLRSATGGWVLPNVTPPWVARLLLRLPYFSPLGISNWLLAEK